MDKIAEIWNRVERSLFPRLRECLPALTESHRDLVWVLETVRIEEHVRPEWMQWFGRKRKDRKALARAFIGKALYNEPTTKSFLDRLSTDESLRRICGWERRSDIPSEATFSRAFAEFAGTSLGDKAHEARVVEYLGDGAVWHVSRDSTEIDAREKPVEKPRKDHQRKPRPGRPKKGEQRPKPEPTRERVESLYDLMDSAYDAKLIRGFSEALGHIPIIPASARHGKVAPLEPDRDRRYNNRTTVERFNSALKDNFGGRMVSVRGKPKVHAHLMFGVLVIFARALLSI